MCAHARARARVRACLCVSPFGPTNSLCVPRACAHACVSVSFTFWSDELVVAVEALLAHQRAVVEIRWGAQRARQQRLDRGAVELGHGRLCVCGCGCVCVCASARTCGCPHVCVPYSTHAHMSTHTHTYARTHTHKTDLGGDRRGQAALEAAHHRTRARAHKPTPTPTHTHTHTRPTWVVFIGVRPLSKPYSMSSTAIGVPARSRSSV